MPIDVDCPSCDQKLRVPDELVGKTVRCQKCDTQFLAVEKVEMDVVEEPPEAGYGIAEEPAKGNRGAAPSRRLQEEDEQDDGNKEGERRRPRRRKRHRKPSAAAQLRMPALLLLISGYLGAVLGFLVIILRVVLLTIAASKAPVGATVSFPVLNFVVTTIGQLILMVGWSAVVIKGSQSMSNISRGIPPPTSRTAIGPLSLDEYQLAVAGCVAAMVPCSCGCMLGLPIGIWGLMLLMQDDVKRAFT
jgi:hypothetical protein